MKVLGFGARKLRYVDDPETASHHAHPRWECPRRWPRLRPVGEGGTGEARGPEVQLRPHKFLQNYLGLGWSLARQGCPKRGIATQTSLGRRSTGQQEKSP